MQILFHLGAHCTDNGLLIRSILRNRAKLAEEGIGIPGPGRYRELLGDVSTKLRGEPANAETEALILEAISDDDTADRIVLSNENFLCRANVVLAPNHLYPKADKSAWLRNALPSHDVEFALALRNPATLLPDLLARIDAEPEAQHRLLADIALKNLLWSDVIYRIADATPGARLIVWCHEDTPFIWSEIMRELTGHDPFTTLDGEFDMLETIISDEGMRRLTDFLASRDVSNPTKRRRAVAAFLEAHAVHEAIEEIIDLPGWTDDTVDALSEQYEDDIALVAKMPGVTLIEP